MEKHSYLEWKRSTYHGCDSLTDRDLDSNLRDSKKIT